MRTDRDRTDRETELIAHGDYLSIVNFREKIPELFRGISGMFCGTSLFLFIHSTISFGTPNDGPRNPGLETLS